MAEIRSIFTVTKNDLERLSPASAVETFRELLWAETRRLGLPITSVNITSDLNIADGGIDASFQCPLSHSQSGLIVSPHVVYQIKASDAFEPWQESEIRKELFARQPSSRENLKPEIRSRLDRDASYVLVTFRNDPTDQKMAQSKANINRLLSECGYISAQIDVISQNMLIGLINNFPSLSLNINGRSHHRFQSHASWSQDDDMMKDFVNGATTEAQLAQIESALRNNDGAVHVRINGEPGIGKTKFALRATSAPDISPLVIYCHAANFRDSDLFNELLRDDNGFSVIVVVDECNAEDCAYIWKKAKHRGPRLKFVTIHADFDTVRAGETQYLSINPLEEDNIQEIIQTYGIPKYQAKKWADFCSGSPRMAHIIGLNFKYNPEDVLREPDTVNVWDRYIAGGSDLQSESFRQTRLVLRHLALFKRFGYEERLKEESDAVYRLISKLEPGISLSRYHEIIGDLRRRKILQGEFTLYITPKLLHIKLWCDWWESYENAFDFEAFIKAMPPKLIEWFFTMFIYAASSKAATKVVERLLSADGPFSDEGLIRTPIGAKFFLALAEAGPGAALTSLERAIGSCSREDLLKFEVGRREVVGALEKIAVREELFCRAATLLLNLAEGENETWANNATGVFSSLFQMGPGAWAATQANAAQRIRFLTDALESGTTEKRRIALKACNAALEAHHFFRIGTPEHQGLAELELWVPKTYGELWDAYRRVWNLLVARLNDLSPELQQQAQDILLKRARGISVIKPLEPMVLETIRDLALRKDIRKKDILEVISDIIRFEGDVPLKDSLSEWTELKERITGHDYHSLMERFVGIKIRDDWRDPSDQRIEVMRDLARQSVGDFELLHKELPWIIEGRADNAFGFGNELGSADETFSILNRLIFAYEERQKEGKSCDLTFLSGYFHALHMSDADRWEDELDRLSEDENHGKWVVEITARSYLSDRAIRRVLDLARKGMVENSQLGMLTYSPENKNLSPAAFLEMLEYLINGDDPSGIDVAIEMYFSCYVYKDPKITPPEDLAIRLIKHKSLLTWKASDQKLQMDEYTWSEIALRLIDLFPERSLEIADFIIEHFRENDTIFSRHGSSSYKVIYKIAERFPQQVWMMVTRRLGPPIDERAFHLKEWLRGEDHFSEEKEGALSLIPLEHIFAWVDEDIEQRAWYLATFVPKQLHRSPGKICLARELLVRFGEREDVRDNLDANYFTEGWEGPESLHYQGKKKALEDFRQSEDNPNVIRWLDETIDSLNKMIEKSRIKEEREF